ncbi:MAG: hypothetical protein FD129_3042, partial [bacterium]
RGAGHACDPPPEITPVNRINVRGLVLVACLLSGTLPLGTAPSAFLPSIWVDSANAASILPTDFIETELGTGYGTLTGFVMLPDGRTLFTEKAGRIRIRSVGGALDTARPLSGATACATRSVSRSIRTSFSKSTT